MDMYVVRARFGLDIALNLRRRIANVHWRVPLDLKRVRDPRDIICWFQENMPEEYQKPEKGWLRVAGQLLLFAHSIEEGDLIFTPDSRPDFREILIGKVVKPYKFEPNLLDDYEPPRHIYHTLEEIIWHEKSLHRDDMPETICTPGPEKGGLDLRGTVYLIKDCRSDLLKVMEEKGINFENAE